MNIKTILPSLSMFWALALPLILGLGAAKSHANDKVLNLELATDHIDVTTGFEGAHVEIFGHRRDKYTDVAVVIRGPSKDMVIWKKKRVLGAWVNRNSKEFKNVPLFYDFAKSDGNIFENKDLMHSSGIGIASLFEKVKEEDSPEDANNELTTAVFRDALIISKKQKGLLPSEGKGVNFINDYFFRTRFFIPAEAPTGKYEIHSLLFKDGRLVERDLDVLTVQQVGMNAFVYTAANSYAVAYGVFSIVLAALCGWFAGALRVKP